MEQNKFLAIRCKLSRGLFSSERTFEVILANGEKYSGPAPIHFCWNDAGKPLNENEAIDGEVDGWVAARRLRQQLPGDQVAVEVPDSEALARAEVAGSGRLDGYSPSCPGDGLKEGALVYLSDRDLEYVVDRGDLIVTPRPQEFGPSGIDLHLDAIKEAKVWNFALHEEVLQGQGIGRPSVGLGDFNYKQFAQQYAIAVPTCAESADEPLVYREGARVILRPGGFFLWQTKEEVGTPTANARYICFINGKSTRTGLGCSFT